MLKKSLTLSSRASKSNLRCFSTLHGKRNVIVFEGDGIGPEIVSSARKCVDAALQSRQRAPIQWLERDAGAPGLAKLSEDDLQAFDDAKLMFKGPLTIKPGQKSWVELRGRKFSSSNQVFRKIFELYANIRPSKSYVGVETPFKNVDWVVFREVRKERSEMLSLLMCVVFSHYVEY
jgi:isocitrate dehydrogenase (NAD+)